MAITSGSTVALALLDSCRELHLHSQFASGVNLACGGYLVHLSADPRGGVCSLGVDERDLALLRASARWSWTGDALVGCAPHLVIDLDPAAVCYPVEAPTLSALLAAGPQRLAQARVTAGGSSWFDAGLGLQVGLPRLRWAIECLVAGGADASAGVRSVIGLGIGLTPSADDAIIGALCVLFAAGTSLTGLGQDLARWMCGQGATATTDVSASYLRLALEGAFSTPLSRVVAALGDDVPQSTLTHAVQRLAATVGATSGLDAAVGIQIAWESLVYLPLSRTAS